MFIVVEYRLKNQGLGLFGKILNMFSEYVSEGYS
jgi:hypothetical protein